MGTHMYVNLTPIQEVNNPYRMLNFHTFVVAPLFPQVHFKCCAHENDIKN